ncbi:2-hydroxyacid dehydrogenase [Leisingera sp.]|uniref:2-hydroxyacid dehydrogenase n=1 Tax=Leisingera sp. TaxID=1879318 RepID=UPI003A922594
MNSSLSVVSAVQLPEQTETALAEKFLFKPGPVEPLAEKKLQEHARNADVLIVAPGAPLSSELIQNLNLRAIATFSVGTDHIDLKAATEAGLPVFNTPGVLTEATADIAMLLLLGAARRATEGSTLLRTQTWEGWTPVQLMGFHVHQKSLGIFGMGRIGCAVALRAAAFGMKIAYHSRNRLPKDVENGAIYHSTRESLFENSDVVLLAAPATSELIGVVDKSLLSSMKRGSILVNISRGDLVVDDDLIAALETGHLHSAGLDVFRNEPQVDPRYWDLPNVFALPHLGSATTETRVAMGESLLGQITEFAQQLSINA